MTLKGVDSHWFHLLLNLSSSIATSVSLTRALLIAHLGNSNSGPKWSHSLPCPFWSQLDTAARGSFPKPRSERDAPSPPHHCSEGEDEDPHTARPPSLRSFAPATPRPPSRTVFLSQAVVSAACGFLFPTSPCLPVPRQTSLSLGILSCS